MENRTKRMVIFWVFSAFFFLVVYLFPRDSRNVIDQSRVADDKKALPGKNAAIAAGLVELREYKKEAIC
jgi:hypothetical protein